MAAGEITDVEIEVGQLGMCGSLVERMERKR